jgi:hypothetical protein
MDLTEEEKQDYQVMLVQTTKAMEAMDAVARMYQKLESNGTINRILDEAEAKGELIHKDGRTGERYPSLELMSVLKALKMVEETQ